VQNLYNPRNSITVSVSGVTVSTGNKIATAKNKTAVFMVTVTPPKGILFNNGAAFNGTANASITSSNTKVVQIMPNKSIKAIGKGTATISIKYGDKAVNYTVTVK
jgi:hypothetical protein